MHYENVASSMLADSIRGLCAEAIATRDPTETEVVLAELRTAIEEYTGNVACNVRLEEWPNQVRQRPPAHLM